jgi:hypothetical protein
MKSAVFSVLALATAANAACAPGQWNVDDNDAMLCDQEQCGVQCLGNAGCVQSCMLARNPTYDTCAVDCAAAAAGCGLSQCFGSCLTGCNDNCVACTAPACGPSYAACLGVELGAQPTTCCPLKNDFLSTMKATPSTWEDCTDPSSPTADRTMTFDPAVPVKGSDNYVFLRGQLLESVAGGACQTTVTWNGVPVLNDSFDVCGNQTVGLPLNLGTLLVDGLDCPQSAGAMDIEIIAQLSVLAPPGAYSIKADCVASDATKLACADVSMRL